MPAVFPAVITALLRSLILPDNGAGAWTALGRRGSQPAPAIMASDHPQARTVALRGLRVSRWERIDVSAGLSLPPLSPAQTSHPRLPRRDSLAVPKVQLDRCDSEQLMAVAVARLVPKIRKRARSRRGSLHECLLLKSGPEIGPVWRGCQPDPAGFVRNLPELLAHCHRTCQGGRDSGLRSDSLARTVGTFCLPDWGRSGPFLWNDPDGE